ncbi:MAG: primosomal protein N' [Candidatus Marinimicrobia bacterium]|nr:primosomal protein N' [Candidatus Neomarinimicrobiota bacterium]
MKNQKYCEVVFPIQVFKSFYYKYSVDQQHQLKPGMRILAPFGQRNQIGYCISVNNNSLRRENIKYKSIVSIIDKEPIFTKVQMKFLKWISEYYIAPLGLTLRAAHPSETGFKKIEFIVMKDDKLKTAKDTPIRSTTVQAKEYESKTNEKLNFKKLEEINFPSDGMPYLDLENVQNEKREIIKSMIDKNVLSIENRWHRTNKEKSANFIKLVKPDEEVKGKVQKHIIKILKEIENSEMKISEMSSNFNISYSSISSLVKKGILKKYSKSVDVDPFLQDYFPKKRDIQYSKEQLKVINKIKNNSEHFFPVLLKGVTGSGKTEIYIELARHQLEQNKDAIILVPEIAITPHIAGRFRSEFKDKVAIWHSQLSASERLWTWSKIMKGEIKIVVGARSAIFSPLKNIGLIVVDEENENTHKQEDQTPRYNARDSAVYYAKLLNIPIILGGATPSIESYYQASMGKYHSLNLLKRFGKAVHPKIKIVDMKKEKYDTNVSNVLLQAIYDKISKGEQVIILQNRRGYNTLLRCANCGEVVQCPNCSVSLTYHKSIDRLICHYCGYSKEKFKQCPNCNSYKLRILGSGTQRVEEIISKKIPDVKIVRMDYDTTRTKNAHARILNKFENGEFNVLLGTQMIAKGLDFPNVTLVGVINADVGLGLPDFRSTEKTFQLIYQVAGRSGRSEKPGEVIVQTFSPEHIAIKMASHLELKKFYNIEMSNRKELDYPPFSRLGLVRVEGKSLDLVKKDIYKVYKILQKEMKLKNILGPAPAPIEKLQNKFRWQILIKSNRDTDRNGSKMRKALASINKYKKKFNKNVRLIINIDPLSII